MCVCTRSRKLLQEWDALEYNENFDIVMQMILHQPMDMFRSPSKDVLKILYCGTSSHIGASDAIPFLGMYFPSM